MHLKKQYRWCVKPKGNWLRTRWSGVRISLLWLRSIRSATVLCHNFGMLLCPSSAENNDSFYESVASGCDFYFYQNCHTAGYDETYFNPDCALLNSEKKEVLWFDLDYTAVAQDQTTNTRKHGYGNWSYEKKFVFSNHDSKMGVLHLTPLQSRISKFRVEEQLRSRETRDVTYIVEDEEWDVITIDEDGTITTNETGLSLEQLWQSHRKMKIAVKLGHFTLIYPIRLAYRHGSIFSFASKTVAIPHPLAAEFEWGNSSIGNICVATDGTISIQKTNTPTRAFENLLPTLFPRLSRKLVMPLRSEKLNNLIKNHIIFRRFWEALRKYAVTYVVKHSKCSFTIFIKRPAEML